MSRIKLNNLDIVDIEVAEEEMKEVFGGQYEYSKAPNSEVLGGIEVRSYNISTTIKTTVEIKTTMKGKAYYAKSVVYYDKDTPHMIWE